MYPRKCDHLVSFDYNVRTAVLHVCVYRAYTFFPETLTTTCVVDDSISPLSPVPPFVSWPLHSKQFTAVSPRLPFPRLPSPSPCSPLLFRLPSAALLPCPPHPGSLLPFLLLLRHYGEDLLAAKVVSFAKRQHSLETARHQPPNACLFSLPTAAFRPFSSSAYPHSSTLAFAKALMSLWQSQGESNFGSLRMDIKTGRLCSPRTTRKPQGQIDPDRLHHTNPFIAGSS